MCTSEFFSLRTIFNSSELREEQVVYDTDQFGFFFLVAMPLKNNKHNNKMIIVHNIETNSNSIIPGGP